jgi:hypothetical protein
MFWWDSLHSAHPTRTRCPLGPPYGENGDSPLFCESPISPFRQRGQSPFPRYAAGGSSRVTVKVLPTSGWLFKVASPR